MPQTCDPKIIDGIVRWVVFDDEDAREKFGDAIRNGMKPYDALRQRLTSDQNALRMVTDCELETREILAGHGFPG